jgi:hypothetical protein
MMPELSQEFQTTVREVLENTIKYGICPDPTGKIRFSEVGEVAVSAEKWCWIVRSQVKYSIEMMADTYSVVGDFVTRNDGALFPNLPSYTAVTEHPAALFAGVSNETFQKLLKGERVPISGLARAVADPEVAAAIAIFLTEFRWVDSETKPVIISIDTVAAAAAGITLKKMPSLFFAFDQLRRDYCSEFGGTDSVLKAVIWKVRLNETLYLDDPDESRLAAKFLFRLKPQPEVERELLAYLRHKSVSVRVNVAQALGLPTYMSGFPLTAPPPSIETLLEPTSVQPDTLREIIEVAKEEKELEVVQWLLCSASSQYYGGKLNPFVGDMRALTRILDTRFGDGVSDFTLRVRAALSN